MSGCHPRETLSLCEHARPVKLGCPECCTKEDMGGHEKPTCLRPGCLYERLQKIEQILRKEEDAMRQRNELITLLIDWVDHLGSRTTACYVTIKKLEKRIRALEQGNAVDN